MSRCTILARLRKIGQVISKLRQRTCKKIFYQVRSPTPRVQHKLPDWYSIQTEWQFSGYHVYSSILSNSPRATCTTIETARSSSTSGSTNVYIEQCASRLLLGMTYYKHNHPSVQSPSTRLLPLISHHHLSILDW